MSTRQERKAREEEGRQRQAAGVKPPRRGAMTPVPEATSPTGESSPLASPSQASPLAGAARESRKLARLRRKGDLAESKRELVGEVRPACLRFGPRSCSAARRVLSHGEER